jgi:hypothetical protein
MVAFSVYSSTIPAQASTPFVVLPQFGAFTKLDEGFSEINGVLPDASTTPQAISFANAAVNTIFTNFQDKLFP